MEHDTHRLIQEMNLSYLLLTQRLLAEDKAVGMSSIGVSAKVADVLMALSLKDIARLASTSQMLCSFRFNDHAVLSALAHHQVKVAAMEQSPARNHASQSA